MLKERLSKISTKVLYGIFAVIISIALWVYVEITENDIQMQAVNNVRITFLNEDLMRDRGFLMTSYTPEQLSITFEAPRSEMARLAATGALAVEVDLANISSTGPSELVYRIIYPAGVNTGAITVIAPSASRITIMIDRLLGREIPVTVSYTGGTASEELMVESIEFDPQFITIWGPESIVSRISYIKVPIPRENLATTFREELEFILIDENDEILELEANQLELLEFSHESVYVTVPIVEMKDVPLTVHLAHGPGTSDEITSVRIEPASIKVSGDPVALREFNNIMLGTIDMLRFGLADTEAFTIIVPNHLSNISGETEAIVHIEVIGLDIAFRSTSNLQDINVPSGYHAEILTQSLDIRLRGSAEDLALVTSMNLRVVADLSERGPGTSRVPARVYIDGIDAYIDAVGEYEITVSILAE